MVRVEHERVEGELRRLEEELTEQGHLVDLHITTNDQLAKEKEELSKQVETLQKVDEEVREGERIDWLCVQREEIQHLLEDYEVKLNKANAVGGWERGFSLCSARAIAAR